MATTSSCRHIHHDAHTEHHINKVLSSFQLIENNEDLLLKALETAVGSQSKPGSRSAKIFAKYTIHWYEDIYLLAPLCYISTIAIGTAAYMYLEGWPLCTSFYFAVQMLLGVGYGVPDEDNDWSYIFSMFYVMCGTTLILGAVGNMCAVLTSSVKTLADTEEIQFDVTFYKRMFFVLWLALGTCYAYYFEEFDLIKSIYFAVLSMSTCGAIAPACDGNDEDTCTLGTRGYLLGLYLAVGVPLYGLVFSDFAQYFVEHSIVLIERRNMLHPLKKSEFEVAARFVNAVNEKEGPAREHGIDLGEFIVLEMIRLNKLDEEMLNEIKFVFDEIDEDNSGIITTKELVTFGLMEAEGAEIAPEVVPERIKRTPKADRACEDSCWLLDSPRKPNNSYN